MNDATPAGPTPSGDPLPLTGERTVPGIAEENYWFRRHEVVYWDIAPRCAGLTVLEAGPGEGYGAAAIAESARRVIGVDYDVAAAEHIAGRYPTVDITRGNLVDLPVADAAVDVVVTLQVIEHLWDQDRFVRECRRVLAPGGMLIMSTPNRITFSPGRDTPLNPFHTRELDPTELTDLIVAGGFSVDSLTGVRHGPTLRELDRRHGGSFVDAQIERALAGEPWPDELTRDVAGITVDDFELTPDDLDASLDLVIVARAPLAP
ncbi:class I SAM-dependent methyltransferase [Rhodococcoides corynebacterioides]|uniref:Class I SAM-dependent methyltransferase n=1 Tax=Rhodococcoides corynebacterioides TaxID=53972 RepID=A0ABS7P333_9NOCA|nr:class I SAM-dependent methyltransferase [Rhodococcus corynebacterioides]MBY6366778.1 class I SAM-dependent methyltransferase [Rhodococcus corynebacterioides]MBY6408462.1 class I SAM-dependent methyltransferase [Rhodococcus corynebacterioides]